MEDCLRLGTEDITIRTSLLERRLIWGDTGLADDLDTRLREDLFAGTGPEFVEAKLAERAARHRRHGGSRYLVEPNVKESKGGLRDLQTLWWLGKYLYNVDEPAALVDVGLIAEDELETFDEAEDFLWSVRSHLHLLAGRATEQLSFDTQVEVASALGFEDANGQRGVERFMQVYFRHARAVGELSRIFLVALEARHIKQKPGLGERLLSLFSAGSREQDTPAGFSMRDGRLVVEQGDQFLADPVNILRLFEVAVDSSAMVHPDALRMVTRNLDLIDDTLRADPGANATFMRVLTNTEHVERGLRRMNETGVLGAFIPEFERIVAMMQYNMYHHYTVDEHTITCISVLTRIERGELADDLPLATAVMRDGGVNCRVLYTALLLHDIGKGQERDHSDVGAEIAARICPRLGLDESDTNMIVWLVQNHLLMSDVAQKRDLSDPRTISDFAAEVKSVKRLNLLLVLTVCDIMGVGPGVWNNWKAVLLRQLYRGTREALTGGNESLERDRRVLEAKEMLAGVLADFPAEARERELDRHYPPYWVGLAQSAHEVVARLIRDMTDGDVQIDFSEEPERDATRASFVMSDHPGMFSRIAGALALVGANVIDARSYTSSDGIAVAVFWVQDADGHAYDAGRRDRLLKTVRRTLKGEVVTSEALAPKDKMKKRESAFIVPTEITFDNTGSDIFTIIEVDTRDRPGLLYDLTRALSGVSVNLFSAIIATYGEQAVDVFYVKDLFGMKLHSESKRRTVEEALRVAIQRRPQGTTE